MDSETKRAAVQDVLREMFATCCVGALASGSRRDEFRAAYRRAEDAVRKNGFGVSYDSDGLPVVSAPDCESRGTQTEQ